MNALGHKADDLDYTGECEDDMLKPLFQNEALLQELYEFDNLTLHYVGEINRETLPIVKLEDLKKLHEGVE